MADQERCAGFARKVAENGEMEAIAAPQDVEPEVEVALGIEGSLAQQAEGVAGELDRVERRQAVSIR